MTESRRALKEAAADLPAAGGEEEAPAATDSLTLARLAAGILDSKKLADISVFDVRETLQITDYFVLASGINSRQIKAACDAVEKAFSERGVERYGIEGYHEGKWLLLDYDTVVVHVFLEEQRRFYDLELLWGDSPKVTLP